VLNRLVVALEVAFAVDILVVGNDVISELRQFVAAVVGLVPTEQCLSRMEGLPAVLFGERLLGTLSPTGSFC